MVRSRCEQSRKTKKEKTSSLSRANSRDGARSRKNRSGKNLPSGRDCPGPTLKLERKVSQRRICLIKANEDRPQAKGRSSNHGSSERQRATKRGTAGNKYRATIDSKKKELGLAGNLHNRHLSKDLRVKLVELVKWAMTEVPALNVTVACEILEINSRAYYCWIKEPLLNPSGGGEKNKVTPLEEKRVVAMAKKNPEWHCRKIAYQLENKAATFVCKTKVAEIMKKHGLNHPFEQNIRPPMVLPADMEFPKKSGHFLHLQFSFKIHTPSDLYNQLKNAVFRFQYIQKYLIVILFRILISCLE